MNYYEILRVPSTANLIEIKKAYKALVKRYHPDIYEGNKLFAELKIKEINQAYEVLKEKSTKDAYDAELNYKKYEPTADDFITKATKKEYEEYQNVYYKQFERNSKKTEVKTKKNISINLFLKKCFYKFDEAFQTEYKQNFTILCLVFLIIVFSINIIKILY